MLCFLYLPQAYTAAYQIFPTLAYENAALLNKVNQYEAILGTTDLDVRVKYVGSVGPQFGSAVSQTNTFLPYLRAASRLHPEWVASFDITHPLFANISYPDDSLVAEFGTDSIIIDTNYSPKISYQITENLALGLGFDVNQVNEAELNFTEVPEGQMFNRSQGLGYGWDAGIAFKLNDSNHMSFSYYSAIYFKQLKGTSQQGSNYRSDFSNNLLAPATYTFNAVHQLNSKWLISETARFVQWAQMENLVMTNSVDGNTITRLNYNDVWSLMGVLRYQGNEHWAGEGLLEYVANVQSKRYRPIALPATAVLVGGGMLEYMASSQWSVQMRYAFVYGGPDIEQNGPPSQLGHINIGVNIVDLSLTWKM